VTTAVAAPEEPTHPLYVLLLEEALGHALTFIEGQRVYPDLTPEQERERILNEGRAVLARMSDR